MKRRKQGLSIKASNRLTGLLFFSPWIVGFLAFTLYPLVFSIVLSFHEVSMKTTGIEFTPKKWEYYATALTVDTDFPIKLMNSVITILTGLPIVLVFSLIIALLLKREFPCRSFFRAVFFLPVIIMSGPVMKDLQSGTSAMTLEADIGQITSLFMVMPDFLIAAVIGLLKNLLQLLWYSGVPTILFLSALQKIDKSMYESASIDGATAWEKFWRITLPHLRPMIILNAIYTIVEIGTFSGNEVNEKIVLHMLEVNRPYSYSAAMSWIYFVVLLLLIGLAFLILNDWKDWRLNRHGGK